MYCAASSGFSVQVSFLIVDLIGSLTTELFAAKKKKGTNFDQSQESSVPQSLSMKFENVKIA